MNLGTCQADPTLTRVQMGATAFPLGVYPVEPMEPREGYCVEFESADGDDKEGEWEEWPDRYVFEVVLTTPRLVALCRSLLAMLPGRVYPILDVLGHDAYREIDPYISYELVGIEHVMDALRQYRDYFFEDGLCGFGAMCDDPFIYLFIDEHKIVTIRTVPGDKDRVERVLRAFDLEPVEEPAGADAVSHEHRGILRVDPDGPELLDEDRVVERLRDLWRLTLNVDAETNLDDDGNDLGTTPWRCLIRLLARANEPERYAEVLVTADSLRQVEELAFDSSATIFPESGDPEDEAVLVSADRLRPEEFFRLLGRPHAGPGTPELEPGRIWRTRVIP